MARPLTIGAAQMGPVQRDDSRQSVVSRLIELMREAHAVGCRLVVYPELALTTFFPRKHRDVEDDPEQWFEREMPSAATRPLFEEAAKLGVGFYLGYAEMTEEDNETKYYNTTEWLRMRATRERCGTTVRPGVLATHASRARLCLCGQSKASPRKAWPRVESGLCPDGARRCGHGGRWPACR